MLCIKQCVCDTNTYFFMFHASYTSEVFKAEPHNFPALCAMIHALYIMFTVVSSWQICHALCSQNVTIQFKALM